MKKFLLLSALAVSGLSMMADDTMITIGGDNGVNKQSDNVTLAPISPYFKNSECQMLWTADELTAAGITSGTVIKGATFYGAALESTKDMNCQLAAYMTTTEEVTLKATNVLDVNTEIYSVETYTMPVLVGSTEEPDAILAFTFDTPYTYNGGSLVMQVNRYNSQWTRNYYIYGYTDLTNHTLVRDSDSAISASASWKYAAEMPKVTFTCETAGTGVKALADNAPAISVKGGVINADAAAISVFNTNGVKVARANGSLDINSLPAGVYIINVRGEQGVSTMRIVK